MSVTPSAQTLASSQPPVRLTSVFTDDPVLPVRRRELRHVDDVTASVGDTPASVHATSEGPVFQSGTV